MDLFEAGGKEFRRGGAPLADRMRPRDLGEFVGQSHLLGPGRVLRQAVSLGWTPAFFTELCCSPSNSGAPSRWVGPWAVVLLSRRSELRPSGHLKRYGKLGMSWVRFQWRFISVPREPAISLLSPSNALWTPEPHSASSQPLFWPASGLLRTGRSLWCWLMEPDENSLLHGSKFAIVTLRPSHWSSAVQITASRSSGPMPLKDWGSL